MGEGVDEEVGEEVGTCDGVSCVSETGVQEAKAVVRSKIKDRKERNREDMPHLQA